ncbi:MAG: ribbon-helix-helix protein, CopG family [Candidatus Lokiarchaeota archaeon]|nr:ribbon-helix-helix protein, CopG family [Candidatus Lokiarchaeota archaeon]
MKIVTVNVPESYLDAIEKLTGNDGLYPSRSELIRCAVRDFLIKELQMAKKLIKSHKNSDIEEELLDSEYVRIPVKSTNENNESVNSFKTYKIVKRLEY